ncbi:BgTH12-06682 [Blumeria graminis f. sp. triticale]|uniref:Bgt-50582 n=2 Tax=Blumeria graminis TaxID=34373 RepID=A0A9X9LBE6_BLUGR|nr:BgTH12-06682 [Blumeria graminis f. sp. triticale]VCU41292.1 Bgt-50582 [Blumeria graminis f. sp. tritici]
MDANAHCPVGLVPATPRLGVPDSTCLGSSWCVARLTLHRFTIHPIFRPRFPGP